MPREIERPQSGRTVAARASQIVQKMVLAGLGTAVAAWLLWLGVATHLQRACVVLDAPYLPLCPDISHESDVAREQALRARIHENPGDSGAWVALANLEPRESQDALLNAVAALAPSDPNSLRLRAKRALDQNQMALATELLVTMTNYGMAGADPPRVLARLVASGEGTALLHPHLVAGSRWLPQVVWRLQELKLPLESALPLMAEAAGKGIVTHETIGSFVRSLKAAGRWPDAYALWVAQQHQPAPILFNAGFENKFQTDGFDWEVTPVSPGRAGALVAQRRMAGHGQVLDIQYTGRAVAIPVIRQYLFLAAGRYALQGQYMSSKLRMEQGLAWAVRCTGGAKDLAGRSEALKDTAGVWQGFGFEFNVPAGCGMMASLQLETFAPYEAAAGFRGQAAFDSFELRRLGP